MEGQCKNSVGDIPEDSSFYFSRSHSEPIIMIAKQAKSPPFAGITCLLKSRCSRFLSIVVRSEDVKRHASTTDLMCISINSVTDATP